MKCKNCRREIEDNSLFCNWCGAKQLVERRKRKTTLVPKARQLSSGKWFIQLRLNKKSISVTADSESAVIAKARAIKDGFIAAPNEVPNMLQAIDSYVDKKYNVLSPSTIRTYRTMQRNRFKEYSHLPLNEVDWQEAINKESLLIAPKTLKSSWGFVCSLLRENNVQQPSVTLPLIIPNERNWLDYEQILVFVNACKGTKCEIGALLALHSLRRSELLGLTWDNVDLDKKLIHVRGAVVPNEDNKFVYKKTNKNLNSIRTVPIMIPELLEALTESEKKNKFVVNVHPDTLRKHINKLCLNSGLPIVGIHGLRHSFASLAYHLGIPEQEVMALGGWSNYDTIHKIYLHLSEQDRLAAANKMAEFYSSK